jgi:hypothetical protein
VDQAMAKQIANVREPAESVLAEKRKGQAQTDRDIAALKAAHEKLDAIDGKLTDLTSDLALPYARISMTNGCRWRHEAIHRRAESNRSLKTCIRPRRCLCVRIGVGRPAEGLVSLPRTRPQRPEPSPYRAVLATVWFVIAPVRQKRGKIVRAWAS